MSPPRQETPGGEFQLRGSRGHQLSGCQGSQTVRLRLSPGSGSKCDPGRSSVTPATFAALMRESAPTQSASDQRARFRLASIARSSPVSRIAGQPDSTAKKARVSSEFAFLTSRNVGPWNCFPQSATHASLQRRATLTERAGALARMARDLSVIASTLLACCATCLLARCCGACTDRPAARPGEHARRARDRRIGAAGRGARQELGVRVRLAGRGERVPGKNFRQATPRRRHVCSTGTGRCAGGQGTGSDGCGRAGRRAHADPEIETAASHRAASRSRSSAAADCGLAPLTGDGRGNHLARWLTTLPPNVLELQLSARLEMLARRNAGASHSSMRRTAHARRRRVPRGRARERSSRRWHRSPALPAATRTVARRLALVGKGICFDTGGINLKPHKSMYQMHEDMQGSAVAVGTLLALSELDVPYDIDCWLAITENEIGARAYRRRKSSALQRRDDPGRAQRCRRPHGARRHAGPCRTRQADRSSSTTRR